MMMDESPNNVYSSLLEKKNMKMSRGGKSLKIINEIHPAIKGNRISVPGLLSECYSSNGSETRPWQKPTHKPALAEINWKGNTFFTDSMHDTFLRM